MKLYCVGDSLVFSYGVRRSDSWVRQLSRDTGLDISNLGICGETTDGILRRLTNDILPDIIENGSNNAAVIITGGYNDIFSTGAYTSALDNMKKMLSMLSELKVKVIVLIPPGLGEAGFPDEWAETVDFTRARETISDYCARLEDHCISEAVPFADLRRILTGSDCLFDGIHPDTPSQKLIADIIKEVLYENQIS